jgi:hypothetical protein
VWFLQFVRTFHRRLLSIAARTIICIGSANVCAEDSLTPLVSLATLATLADDCQSRLALNQDPEGEALLTASACPELITALRDSEWRGALFDTTPDTLTIEQVRDLAILTERYATPIQPNPGLSRQSLDTILDALPKQHIEEKSAWDRVWDWLKAQFEAQTNTDLSTLLEKLTGWINADWVLSIFQLGFAAATLAAVVIFIRELHKASVFGKRNKPVDESQQRSGATPDHTSTVLPLKRQPAALLGAVVTRLRGHALPPEAPSMTVNQIRQQVAALTEPMQEQISGLATGSELIAYADWQPDDSQLRELVITGETLLRELSRQGTP